MDAHDLRRAIRRSWWLILLITTICGGAAVAYTLASESRYESDTQLFVVAQERERGIQSAPSYAGLVTSPNVTAPVVKELGLGDTPLQLGKRITATAPPDTVLINLTVEDNDPVRAQATGRAIANRLIKLVEQLERPNKWRQAPVRLFVSSPASLPSDRVAPNAPVNLAAGLVLGLLLGLLTAVLRGRLDRRIWAPDDLPEAPGQGVLGALPIDKTAGARPAAGLSSWSPERAEPLRRLRTNLRFLAPGGPAGAIVVASALPGEGASTTAVGLALALAEAGSDVVLVEADLRRPWLTEHLGLRRNEGLAGHLASGAAVGGLLQPSARDSGVGKLRVLVAGTVPANPSELVGSERMRALIADLRERCDVVVVDAPPLLSVTDGAVLAGEADGVLLVVRIGRSTRPELDRALDILTRSGARVLGFVANGAPSYGGRAKRRAYPAVATPREPARAEPPREPAAPTPRAAEPPREPAAPEPRAPELPAPAPRASAIPPPREPRRRPPLPPAEPKAAPVRGARGGDAAEPKPAPARGMRSRDPR